MDTPKRTVLFELHRRLGARMTQFAGFEMPLQYSGIIEEHRAVRRTAGLFDLSHMGEFYVQGPGALDLLERALTNSAARLAQWEAQYSVMCAEDGGTIDDLVLYRTGPEQYMLCVNASNIEVDREWLMGLKEERTGLRDASEETGLIAIQGPQAVELLGALAAFPLEAMPRFHVARGKIAGVECIAARTGYTGEDGFELFVDAGAAERLFAAILEAGRNIALKPCGLGARDTLRLEAGFPLYGHELDRSRSPLEARLDAFVKLGRGFIGERALAEQKRSGAKKRLVGLTTDDAKTILRQGYRLFSGDRSIGTVTSGTFGPSVGRPVAMAYVAASENTSVGAKVEAQVRNRKARATITSLPFYKTGASVERSSSATAVGGGKAEQVR